MNKHILTSPLLTPVAILLGSIIIAGGIVWSSTHSGRIGATISDETGGQPAAQALQQQKPAAQAADSSKVSVKGEPYIGRLDAPVVIAYWYDYQCPFCKQNEQTSVTNLVKDYVDTGKVRIVFKDYEFLGPDSIALGAVSRAVWLTAPDKFYDWHKAVFDNQGRENTGWATKEKILSITSGVLGQALAAQAIALADKNADTYKKDMDADKAEGLSFGINGTPAMLIGKTLITGAEPYANIKAAVVAAMVQK